jgi:hypothetical protein
MGTALPEQRPIPLGVRRAIIDKLTDVYVDERVGYSGDWTDAKVAGAMSPPVPREFVARLRAENFGPERSSEHIRQALAEAKAEQEQIKAGLALLTELNTRAAKVERTLADIEKSLR